MTGITSRLRPWMVIAAGLTLAGCVQTRLHMSDDFGQSLARNMEAQTTTPDPKYAGTPAPASNGQRTALAQDRYVTGKVTPPVSLSAAKAVATPTAAPAP